MGSALLLLSSLLLAPDAAAIRPNRSQAACICTESSSREPCGIERTTCHCLDAPAWMRVRYWAPESERCEELVFFLNEGAAGSGGAN